MRISLQPLLDKGSSKNQRLPEIAPVSRAFRVKPLSFVPTPVPSTSKGVCHLLCSASISRANPFANLVKLELPVEGVGGRSTLSELIGCVRIWTFRGRGVGSPSLTSTCDTRTEEGRAVSWCNWGGRCWFEMDIVPSVRPCV